MVALKVFFGTECRRCNQSPSSLSELKDYLYSITGLRSPLIQYKDEEGDLISIFTDAEYLDLVSGGSALIKLIVSPSKIEQSSETFPVPKEDSASLTVPYTLEQSISTRVNTSDKSLGTAKPPTHEIGCDPQGLVSKKIETVPLKMNSVESGPNEIVKIDKFTKTKNNLLESIRIIIREELGKGDELKLSGIVNKHLGIMCNHCKEIPIVGIRYKCSECHFNFCEKCEFYQEHEHPFYKIRNPLQEKKEEPPKIVKNEPPKSKMLEKFEEIKMKQEKYSSLNNKKPEILPEKKTVPNEYKQNILNLKNMGFDNEEVCLSALIACKNNIEEAIESLVANHFS